MFLRLELLLLACLSTHLGAEEASDVDAALSSDDDVYLQLRQLRSNRLQTLQAGKELGTIYAMYTFGAPATSKPAMPDLTREDQCFRGLRSYTENKLAGGGRGTDAAAMFDAYPHAKIATLALDYNKNSLYVPCPGEPKWPKGGGANWGLHSETHYLPRLKALTIDGKKVADEEPFATAIKMGALAYKSYDSVEHTKQAISEKLPGWRLVDHQVFEWFSGAYDDDPIMVVQEDKTLDCALVFTGTNKFSELFESIKQHTTGFCGFDAVHAGYRDEIWQLSDHSIWPKITSKLEKCNRVTCVGHSLGGAMCDVFSGCINSGRVDDPDFKKIMWYKGTPTLMPELGSQAEKDEVLGADSKSYGIVDALYTYGAPASAHPPLQDTQNEGGCWKGLRVYTEDDMPGGGKQVDARAFSQDYFPHPMMPTLSLQWKRESHFAKCGEGTKWPEHHLTSYENWGLSAESNYVDRLERLIKESPGNTVYSKAFELVHAAFGADKTKEKLQEIMKQVMPGWKLVARENVGNKDEPALLVQESKTLDCALVMPGYKADRKQTYGTGFCGMENVHSGYRNYLVETVEKLNWYELSSKFPKCRNLACTGHSQGGALCELFAACVNNGKIADQDYRRMMWTKETPQALPEI
eukprot:TRINITY_DN4915_c0_g1_i1.p1 TRINITY_DN4915_c0_g1~~TRINITY_DN4915_c0_g1_i1.p1  ORF type:complete len:637 (+),score=137.18 TRINITY_DN4915_c0_g1_i1:59-1969(+)